MSEHTFGYGILDQHWLPCCRIVSSPVAFTLLDLVSQIMRKQ